MRTSRGQHERHNVDHDINILLAVEAWPISRGHADPLNELGRTETLIEFYFLTEGDAVFTICSGVVYRVRYEEQA